MMAHVKKAFNVLDCLQFILHIIRLSIKGSVEIFLDFICSYLKRRDVSRRMNNSSRLF